jgi:hypothetical protein
MLNNLQIELARVRAAASRVFVRHVIAIFPVEAHMISFPWPQETIVSFKHPILKFSSRWQALFFYSSPPFDLPGI